MSKIVLVNLFVGLTFLFGSCSSAGNNAKEIIEVEKSSIEKTVDFMDEFITNPKKFDKHVRIDSIEITNETVVDSLERKSYLRIKPIDSIELFKSLKKYFDEKYGFSKGSSTFCSWKKINSSTSYSEVLLMNESQNKKYPYLVIEIEEINE